MASFMLNSSYTPAGDQPQAIEKIVDSIRGGAQYSTLIGVTGSSIEMDVYDIDPEQVRKNADGVIDTIALAEGISVSDVTSLSCSDRIVPVDFNNIPDEPISDCPMERWIKRG